MKWLLALLAIAAMPQVAAAQTVPHDQLSGVWTGTVGTQPVHACFDWHAQRGDGELAGIYYYDRHMAVIRLRPDGALLAESEGYNSLTGAHWRIDSLAGTTMPATLRATFVQGARQVPIRLERSPWQPADPYDLACGSEAFLAPRFAGGEWVEERGWFDGHGVITTNWLPPEHFRRNNSGDWDVVALAGLQLVETQAGDAAINRQLAYQTRVADAMDCLAAALAGSAAMATGRFPCCPK